ncbi:MAG: hypothetical protein U9Q67_02965 [Patescibacteria group bacterium]|nr:hypothetical protein [Patescibacteria group bacterium]
MFKSLKKQFILDGAVILLIIIGSVIFVLVTKKSAIGWEIKDSTQKLSNEEKEVSENVVIYKGGNLEMENSTLTLLPVYDNEIGVFVAGDSYLSLEDSKIESEEFQFFVSANPGEDTSPEIILEDSEICGHSGIYLQNRTKFYAKDSIVEELHLRDDVKAELVNSNVYPVLFSDSDETYTELSAGDDITYKLESEKGWILDMTGCEVWGYQIDIYDGNNITVVDSSDLVLSLHSPGNLGEKLELSSQLTDSEPSDGELDEFGAKFSWQNTIIDMMNVYVESGDEVSVENNLVNEADVSDEGVLNMSNLTAHCNLCSATDSSELLFENVEIVIDEDTKPTLTISGNANVQISNSDITELTIIVMGNGNLTITDSEYNEDNIDNLGQGSIIFE